MKRAILLAAASVVGLLAAESTAQAARVDLCKLQASQLNSRALSGIARKGCPYWVSVASLNGGSGGGYVVGSVNPNDPGGPGTNPGGTDGTGGTSIVDVNTDGGVNAGVLGGSTGNTGGVNVGVGSGSASDNSGGINVGALGSSSGSSNTGGLNIGVGSGAASGNSGGINADIGGSGAGSNNAGGINVGVGGSSGISAHVGSGGISVSSGR